MIIGYARVSTTDQNLDLQLDALQKEGCEGVYSEKMSGRNLDRPELTQCLKALRKGDTLIVWRLDRLGRSIHDLINTIQMLGERGVNFKSITEAIDTNTITGKLMFHIIASLAEFERSLIRERVNAGLAAARARGRVGGRKRKMSKSDTKKAVAMLTDPTITKVEVAAHFGVSRPTLDSALNKLGDMGDLCRPGSSGEPAPK